MLRLTWSNGDLIKHVNNVFLLSCYSTIFCLVFEKNLLKTQQCPLYNMEIL